MRLHSFRAKAWALPLVGVLALCFGAAHKAVGQDEDDDEGGVVVTQDAPEDAPKAAAEPRMAKADPEPTVTPVPKAKMDADDTPEKHYRGLRVDGSDQKAIFGRYRVRLLYSHPNFTEMKYYNNLYGSPSWYPEVGADWFAWDWYATLGISFRMGYYTADGRAAQCPPSSTGGSTSGNCSAQTVAAQPIVSDPNSSTTLTLIPLKVMATAEFTPFRKKWVVFDAWLGIERMYFQETRNPLNSNTSATAVATPTPLPTTTTGTTGTTATVTPDTTLTNTGWKNSSVIGMAANILLNPLDETSADSMRGPMGLGSVYFTPYLEYIRTFDKGGISFSRNVYGIAFTFETIN